MNSAKLKIFVLLFFSGLHFTHAQTFFKDQYVSHHTFSFFKSNVVSLVNNGTTTFDTKSDDGFSLQSKHGLIFLKRFSFQVGTGIEYSMPLDNFIVSVFFDLKFYVYKYAETSPYLMIGKAASVYYSNFKLDETYVGIGFAFEISEDLDLIIELTRRIRGLDQNKNQIFMNNENYGLGIKF